MDKRSVIGFVLIAAVLIIWMYTNAPTPAPRPAGGKDSLISKRELAAAESTAVHEVQRQRAEAMKKREDGEMSLGKWFQHLSIGSAQSVTVKTDLYTAELSTQGGSLKRFTLNKFFTWNNEPVQLIDWALKSDFNMVFGTSDGRLIDTRNLFFAADWMRIKPEYLLRDSNRVSIRFTLPVVRDSAVIVKTFTFQNGTYKILCDIEVRNMGGIISNYEYQVGVSSPSLTEHNSQDEAGYANAFVLTDMDLKKIDATSDAEIYRENINERTHWVTTRNKYFMNAVICDESFEGHGAYVEGRLFNFPDNGSRKVYSANLKVKYLGQGLEKRSFALYFGPIEYDLLREVHDGLEKTMNLGWAWVVRPISEYLMLPLFKFLHTFIPNYGLVIILFSIIIKIILLPLTKSSMDSMRKMQALQPLMNELKEKYKEDTQKLNAEMMRLYKEYGINPLGGCLPLLLQMPILYALFTIFGSTIQLRQAEFFWWIKDLATPDSILDLPFSFPLFGFQHLSGLSLLMGITMFVQQKQSVKDPRQKSMVYMMPILFTLMFNSFPSGLNLYYFVFNLLSIGQQYYLNNKYKDVPLQKVQKKSKKKSWAEKYMQTLQQATKDRAKKS